MGLWVAIEWHSTAHRRVLCSQAGQRAALAEAGDAYLQHNDAQIDPIGNSAVSDIVSIYVLASVHGARALCVSGAWCRPAQECRLLPSRTR